MKLDVDHIRQQISNLLLECPELAEDDILRADMIEAETDAVEFLREIERRRQDAAAMAEALDIHISNLRRRQRRFENRDHACRQLLFKVMQAADWQKKELPEATLSIRASAPRVIITCEALLPLDMWRFKKEPDKTKIKVALQTGSVPGAELSNAEAMLSIRTK